jgi:hypothetical protein
MVSRFRCSQGLIAPGYRSFAALRLEESSAPAETKTARPPTLRLPAPLRVVVSLWFICPDENRHDDTENSKNIRLKSGQRFCDNHA